MLKCSPRQGYGATTRRTTLRLSGRAGLWYLSPATPTPIQSLRCVKAILTCPLGQSGAHGIRKSLAALLCSGITGQRLTFRVFSKTQQVMVQRSQTSELVRCSARVCGESQVRLAGLGRQLQLLLRLLPTGSGTPGSGPLFLKNRR